MPMCRHVPVHPLLQPRSMARDGLLVHPRRCRTCAKGSRGSLRAGLELTSAHCASCSSSTILIPRKGWHMLLNLCFHIAMTAAVFAGGITLTGYRAVCQAVGTGQSPAPRGPAGRGLGGTAISAASPPQPRPPPAGRHHLALLVPLHAALDGRESPSALQGGDLEGAAAAGRGHVPGSPQTHAEVRTPPCPSPTGASPGAGVGSALLSRELQVCSDTSPLHRFYLIAGGIPLIICGITAAVNIQNYHDNNP